MFKGEWKYLRSSVKVKSIIHLRPQSKNFKLNISAKSREINSFFI